MEHWREMSAKYCGAEISLKWRMYLSNVAAILYKQNHLTSGVETQYISNIDEKFRNISGLI